MPLHTALAKSKNMVSIRILQAVGPHVAQDWISRFGFEADKHPPYLTMALGAGSVTPMQMATAYDVFANGGYRVNPWLVTKITDYRGRTLVESQPPLPSESLRAIDARNAFMMDRLLQEVAHSGTAARAGQTLKRPDIYGKTGTTNDSIDTWFNGFQPTLVAIVWMGYDTPRSLGDKETGGGLSLPVWVDFMQSALKGVPIMEPAAPEGVVNVGGEWYYQEYAHGGGVSSLGGGSTDAASPAASAPRPPEDRTLLNSEGQPPIRTNPSMVDDRKSILDLFRN
jgi:penicillin-binding protein 1A